MQSFRSLISATAALVLLAVGPVPVSAQAISVTVDGQSVPFAGQGPVMRAGTVLVPLRGVFEKLGASVSYEAPTKRIVATKGETAVVLVIGSETAYVNGEPNKLLLPASVMNGSTMVPLRFVSEALGAQVAWKKEISTVEIATAASNVGNLPTPGSVEKVTGRVTGVFPQLNPPLVTLMVNGKNTQVPLTSDVAVLVKLPDGRTVNARLSDILRGDQVTVKIGAGGAGILVESAYGERSGTVKSVQLQANSNYLITLDDGTKIELAADAPVTMAGRKVSISDIHPGEHVVIRTNPQTGLGYGLAVATADEPDPVPPAAVKATSFNISPTGFVKLGDTITATLSGTPGGTAVFELPGVKGAEAIPMTERSSGTYTGTFKVPAGVSAKGVVALATLKKGSIAAPTIQSAGTVSIDSVPPAISGMTPAEGDTVASSRPLIYANLSDASSGVETATVELDGVDVTSETTVTPLFFSYRPATALAAGSHTVKVRVTDSAGNAVEEVSRFTIQTGVIKEIAVQPSGPFAVGDTISVTMKSSPGGRGTFGIGERIAGVALEETSSGTYKGSYKVKSGDSVEKAPLTVTFKPKSGDEITATASESITINAGVPDAPVITAPVQGAVTDGPLVIAGKARPNAKVAVRISYIGQLLILPVEGTLAETEVNAGADGKWKTEPLSISKPAGVSKIRYIASAAVVDASGQESEQATVEFKRK